MKEILEKIAKDTLGITLECQYSDSLDFHNIACWTLKDMLEKAYKAGQEAGGTNE